MTSPSPTTPAARPVRLDIEGLRAVAVGTVLLYHLHVPWFSGGFAGVDVFFVISGFLITSLLLREVARTGTVSLKDFYARRARRLLPAASVVIAFTLAGGWLVLPASERTNLLSDVLGSTLYVVNWVLAGRSVDYLAEDAGVSPLQHYWSLSVEEQFYIVWPLLILLAVVLSARYRLRRRRIAFLLLGALGAASLLWSVVQTRTEPATAYFVTTTRLWELAAGALLAFLVPRLSALPRWAGETGVLLGLGLILYAVLGFDASTPWPGTAALVPVLGSVLVIAAGVPGHRTLGGSLLGLAPMVWIGGLSYAIYLWHWPLVVLAEARWGELPWVALVGLGVLAVGLAWATKHLVEDPIRYQRSLAARPGLSLAFGGTTMAVICAVALVGWVTRPTLSESTTTPGPAALVADPAAQSWEPLPDPTSAYTATGPLEPLPELALEDVPPYYADGCQVAQGDPEPRDHCVYGSPDSGTEVVLWGDSKMGQYFSAFDAIAEEEDWRLTTYLKSACAPTVAGDKDDCNAFGRTVLDRILAQETTPHLVLMSTGAEPDPELTEGIVEAAAALRDAGISVVLVADNAHPGMSAYDCAAENSDDLRRCDFAPDLSKDALIRDVAEAVGVPTIDPTVWICPDPSACPVAIGGQLIYRQGSHITDTFARSLTPFLHRELSELGLTAAEADEIALDEVPVRAAE
ncbi:SGNH hydrolase domain-containing protein [Ornithinimicrobium humiphilum]|uniref:Peptidoglycan/LPS O-acetylase OafA/YrhL n=1 Tax=Ornithinimicrobium humiphilum TaxID=125288 RepID=A0A543K5C1_9MICO|nr:acyltransferase family protein [Ornithinimicrobium humiphilum]TQM90277.1 peptidoglycan/LPS O-acetylase OafA/YrhL [Ornithinimicrobium humiphilum]